MNPLSLFSFFNFICFVLSVTYLMRINTRTAEIKAFILTNLSLALWTFSYTFFYVAVSKEEAWFWHRAAIIGGYYFPCFSVYYYFHITKAIDKINKRLELLIFAILPFILVVINLTMPMTSCAIDLVQSTSGLGWTYINSISSILYWVYILYVIVYFSVGFYFVHKWGKHTKVRQYRKQSHILVYLFGAVLICGMITDFILPLFNRALPPMANLLLIFVLYGDWLIFERYSFFSAAKKSNSHIILNTITDAVMMINAQAEIIRVNPAFTQIFGYTEKELLNKQCSFLFQNQKVYQEYLDALLKHKVLRNRETDIIASDQRRIRTILSASIAVNKSEGFLGIVISLHDITERKKMEMLWHEEKERYKALAKDYYQLANFDVLTGLPNRRLFYDKLEAMQIKNDKSRIAVIYMDLDGFKQMNDIYGHDVGDKVLIEAANRLRQCLDDEGGIVSRLGGDEFVMLLTKNISDEFIRNKIKLIKHRFDEPVILQGVTHEIGISAGYAIYSNPDDSIETLIREADMAMYQDKQNRNLIE